MKHCFYIAILQMLASLLACNAFANDELKPLIPGTLMVGFSDGNSSPAFTDELLSVICNGVGQKLTQGAGVFDLGIFTDVNCSSGENAGKGDIFWLKIRQEELVQFTKIKSSKASLPGGLEPAATSQDLWHEVQAAYSWRDLQRLEKILAALSGKKPRTVDLDVIPISHIMELRRDVEQRLYGLKSRIGTAQNEKAWKFHTIRKHKRKLQTLYKKINYELQADLRGINGERTRLERQIAMWDIPPPRKRRQ